jgi:hypothetical protein
MTNEQNQFTKDKKYRENFEKYRNLNKQKAEIEANMDSIKEEVAKMLHEDQINEKIVELLNGEEWKGTYQTTSRTVTDLKALMEMVGPQRYGQVVSNKESTFLTIRKAGKKKKDESLISNKPVNDNNVKSFIPDGIVLS